MMKYIAVAVVVLTITLGCSGRSPVAPEVDEAGQEGVRTQRASQIGPHRVWEEGGLYFSQDHNRVNVVPRRHGRFHLNALKFLEESCTDCLEITRIQNNGDGTIDLTVKITHPFPGHPQYTGFDVKGIIMFNGSHQVPHWTMGGVFPGGDPWDLAYFYVSWREVGDPEVLNPDGYSVLWSPWWDSGSEMPIFNYWKGKYSFGTPTANINAYLDFYTDEERHMFRDDGEVERTYHISLPPGPVVAGYAVDACWEPPAVTPVTDPINDFPITANQSEPYFYRFVINNGEPITEKCCESEYFGDCTYERHEFRIWYGEPRRLSVICFPPWPDWILQGSGRVMQECTQTPPPGEHWLFEDDYPITHYYNEEDGNYRGVARMYHKESGMDPPDSMVYTVFDFTIDFD